MEIRNVDLNGIQLGMVIRDGSPWFVLADVEEQFSVDGSSVDSASIEGVKLVSEQTLYILMLLGKSEAAERFKKWLLSDVLGSIRVHGKYPVE